VKERKLTHTKCKTRQDNNNHLETVTIIIIIRNTEGSGRDLTEVLSRHLPGGEENHEKPHRE
jgi:hypothetical protein